MVCSHLFYWHCSSEMSSKQSRYVTQHFDSIHIYKRADNNNARLTNVGHPSHPNDAATKNYVDSNINSAGLISGTGIVISTNGNVVSVSNSLTHLTEIGNVNIGTWSANTINVPYGGTGQSSLLPNKLLAGNGTNPVLSINELSIDSGVFTANAIVNVLNTTNSIGIGSGGSFTTLGGASISKDLFVGGNLQVVGDITVGNIVILGTSSFVSLSSINVTTNNLTTQTITSGQLSCTRITTGSLVSTNSTLSTLVNTNFINSNITSSSIVSTFSSIGTLSSNNVTILNLTNSNLVFTNATGTNLRLTNCTINNFMSSTGTITTINSTNVSVSGTITSSNLFVINTGSFTSLTSSTLQVGSGSIANILSSTLTNTGSITTGNLTSINVASTNITATNIIVNNVTSNNIVTTQLTSFGITNTNMTTMNILLSNASAQNIIVSGSATFGSVNANTFIANQLSTTNYTSQNILAVSVTSGSLLSSNLVSTNVTTNNLQVSNVMSTNVMSTNITSSNITNTNIAILGTVSSNNLSTGTVFVSDSSTLNQLIATNISSNSLRVTGISVFGTTNVSFASSGTIHVSNLLNSRNTVTTSFTSNNLITTNITSSNANVSGVSILGTVNSSNLSTGSIFVSSSANILNLSTSNATINSLFVTTTSTSNLQVGNNIVTKRKLTIGSDFSGPPNTSAGSLLSIIPTIYTDNSSPSNTTNDIVISNIISPQTLTSINTNIVANKASTLYVETKPIEGANHTVNYGSAITVGYVPNNTGGYLSGQVMLERNDGNWFGSIYTESATNRIVIANTSLTGGGGVGVYTYVDTPIVFSHVPSATNITPTQFVSFSRTTSNFTSTVNSTNTSSGALVISGGVGISRTLNVNSIAKGSGTFDIPHPIHSNKRLLHSFVEGPRCDLIYRGQVNLSNGTAHVNLDSDCVHENDCAMSPGTFVALCANPQFFLQNPGSFDRLIGDITGNTMTITCENGNSTETVYWMVVAERKDPTIKDWNNTNSNGYLKTEYNS